MQLIYRWTKSLDPSLKRGFWTPEEDAVSLSFVTQRKLYSGSLPGYPKYNCVPFLSSGWRHCQFSSFLQKLLQAVAKYGAHDWFKIREEVPGRSDAQCRDR